jgi:hypothetical protein
MTNSDVSAEGGLPRAEAIAVVQIAVRGIRPVVTEVTAGSVFYWNILFAQTLAASTQTIWL